MINNSNEKLSKAYLVTALRYLGQDLWNQAISRAKSTTDASKDLRDLENGQAKNRLDRSFREFRKHRVDFSLYHGGLHLPRDSFANLIVRRDSAGFGRRQFD
jgi:hypothetical protein